MNDHISKLHTQRITVSPTTTNCSQGKLLYEPYFNINITILDLKGDTQPRILYVEIITYFIYLSVSLDLTYFCRYLLYLHVRILI